jgi:hypothetical protein
VSSCRSQQNIVAFNKQREQCTSLSPLVNFFFFQIFRSITVGRLMTSVEQDGRVSCLVSEINTTEIYSCFFFGGSSSLLATLPHKFAMREVRGHSVTPVGIKLPLLYNYFSNFIGWNITSSNSNWDIRKAGIQLYLQFKALSRDTAYIHHEQKRRTKKKEPDVDCKLCTSASGTRTV